MKTDIIRRLITNHDYFHLHKIVGTVALVHFAYQYGTLLWTGSFQLQTTLIHLMLPVHTALSISSLIFYIPKIRNPVSPMIYPEFRLHSICFALRSIVCCYIHLYKVDPQSFYKMGICFATMALSDVATYFTRTSHTPHTTMRNMPFPKTMSFQDQQIIITMQSTMQVGATLFMLGSAETAFAPLFAIQLAAFLMTLVRKNILTAMQWHQLYSLSLWINVFCYYSVSPGWVFVQISMLYLFVHLRFRHCLHKYLVWAIVFGLYWLLEYMEIQEDITRILQTLLYFAHPNAFQRVVMGLFVWSNVAPMYCLFSTKERAVKRI